MASPVTCNFGRLALSCKRLISVTQSQLCLPKQTVSIGDGRIRLLYRSFSSLTSRSYRLLPSDSVSSQFQLENVGHTQNVNNGKNKIWCEFYTGLRESSSLAATVSCTAAASSANSDVVAAGSSVLQDPSTAIDAVNTIATISEPTLSSLGLGLANWWPSSLVQAALESIHVGLDVPWWTAIVIGTVCIRVAIFPLVILAQRNAIELQNNMPTMQRLQERMILARRSGDHVGAMKASEELMMFMHRNKINPLKNMLVPFAQIPIFLSMYRGLNGMAELPVVSMQTGGLLWFTDLTIQDPFYALPLMTVATLFVTIEVGVDGIKANQMGSQQMKYFMRAMPVLIFPFIIHFPSAMLCYWFTSNAFSLVQVLFLKIPAVREFFGIPKLIDHNLSAPMKKYDVPKKGFIEGFRESVENMSLAAQMQQRQEANALKLKEPKKTAAATSVKSSKQK